MYSSYLKAAFLPLVLASAMALPIDEGGSSSELDKLLNDLSPGYWEEMEKSNATTIPRSEWNNEPVGSLKWCSSAASDVLSDSEWDALCDVILTVSNSEKDNDEGPTRRK